MFQWFCFSTWSWKANDCFLFYEPLKHFKLKEKKKTKDCFKNNYLFKKSESMDIELFILDSSWFKSSCEWPIRSKYSCSLEEVDEDNKFTLFFIFIKQTLRWAFNFFFSLKHLRHRSHKLFSFTNLSKWFDSCSLQLTLPFASRLAKFELMLSWELEDIGILRLSNPSSLCKKRISSMM